MITTVPITGKLSRTLVKLRNDIGVSQAELSRRSGVSRRTLNRIEKNKLNKTSYSNIFQILNSLQQVSDPVTTKVEILKERQDGSVSIDLRDSSQLPSGLKVSSNLNFTFISGAARG